MAEDSEIGIPPSEAGVSASDQQRGTRINVDEVLDPVTGGVSSALQGLKENHRKELGSIAGSHLIHGIYVDLRAEIAQLKSELKSKESEARDLSAQLGTSNQGLALARQQLDDVSRLRIIEYFLLAIAGAAIAWGLDQFKAGATSVGVGSSVVGVTLMILAWFITRVGGKK